MDDRFTDVTDALDRALLTVEHLSNTRIVPISDDYERLQVLNMVGDIKDCAELLHRILSDAKKSMGGKVSTIRVSTSVDQHSMCKIPPEVMGKEVEYQHAHALAREVARHALISMRQDLLYGGAIFETTVTFVEHNREKN
jgi:uncharacterized protein YjaG (DUF416 family)